MKEEKLEGDVFSGCLRVWIVKSGVRGDVCSVLRIGGLPV